MKDKLLSLICLTSLFLAILFSLWTGQLLDSEQFAQKSSAFIKQEAGRSFLAKNFATTSPLLGQEGKTEEILEEEFSQKLWPIAIKTIHQEAKNQIEAGDKTVILRSGPVYRSLAQEIGLPRDQGERFLSFNTVTFTVPAGLKNLAFTLSLLWPLLLFCLTITLFFTWKKRGSPSVLSLAAGSIFLALFLFLLLTNLVTGLIPLHPEIRGLVQATVLRDSLYFITPFLFFASVLAALALKQKRGIRQSRSLN